MKKRWNKPKSKYLLKYMDLYKFLDFISNRRLYFSPLSKLDDLLEGASESDAVLFKDAHRTASTLASERNPGLAPSVYDEYGVELLNKQFQLEKYQKLFCVSCFYELGVESDAMWNLYTSNRGIALRFDSLSLYNLIENYFNQYLFGSYYFSADSVEYKPLRNLEVYDSEGKIKQLDAQNSVFWKDVSFRGEEEYRFMLAKKNSEVDDPFIKIDNWSTIDFRVICAPNMDDWQIELIRQLVKEKIGEGVPVDKSDIVTRKILARYRLNYLDKIIEKQGGYTLDESDS